MLLTELIQSKDGISGCNICGGVGLYLEEFVKGSRTSEIVLCSCLSEHCKTCNSKGSSPYMDYDEEQDVMIPCLCQKSRYHLSKLDHVLKKSNIPPRYKFKSLAQLDTNELSFLAAYDWASTLVQEWKNNKAELRGMYLYGGTGSGKTLLACSILNELIIRFGVKCKYAKINKDFLSALRDTYSTDSDLHGRERSIETEFAEVDVLVIDDFGVQKDSDWANAKLYDMIDARYEKNKITLLTSNHPLAEWKEKGEGRLYSRLYEMTREIHLECADYRMKSHA